MENIKINNLTLKIFPILICFILLFPIFKENISSLGIILLCLNLIIYKVSSKDFSFVDRKTLLFTIPFWVVLFTSVFSTNIKISVIHIQHALFFLIIPIIFSLIPKKLFSHKKIKIYLSVLKNTCLLICVIYVSSYFGNVSFWKFKLGYYEYSDFREYVYNEFNTFKIHPTYFTSILILCTVNSYELVLKQKKYLELIYVFVFTIMTFLLLTRLNVMLLVSWLLIMTLFRSALKLKSIIALGLSILTLFALLIFYVPGISVRFSETINSFNTEPKNLEYDSTNVRKAILDCDLTLAKENWISGIGYENLQNYLNECYQLNYNSSFYLDHNYMTHNYYFYILICSGVLGFICFLFYVGYLIKTAFKNKVFLLNVLLINTLITCFVEDYFYRQYGVLYFNLLLMIFNKYKENKNTNLTENDI